MKQIPIIIDTDPGVDDFFCIALACAYKELFDIRALTTIGGNCLTDVTTRNALDILKLLKRDDVIVARGADKFLVNEFADDAERFHGKNGLAGAKIEHSDRKPSDLSAWDIIYQEAKKCNGELVLVTVGPKTNLALAFNKYPDLKHMIKKIVVMGGTLEKGNVTKYAEANIYNDAEAAKIVFEQNVPIDMVGLNITQRALLDMSIFDGIDDIDENIKNVMTTMVKFRQYEVHQAMHDSVAFSSLISDKIITFKDAYTYIIDGNVEKRGMSVVEYDKTPNSRVAVDINLDEYYKVIKEMISRYKA